MLPSSMGYDTSAGCRENAVSIDLQGAGNRKEGAAGWAPAYCRICANFYHVLDVAVRAGMEWFCLCYLLITGRQFNSVGLLI